VARTLEIDQGPYDSVDNSASFVGQREAIAIAANLRDADKQRGDTVSQKLSSCDEMKIHPLQSFMMQVYSSPYRSLDAICNE
jgi:hypothetical protein